MLGRENSLHASPFCREINTLVNGMLGSVPPWACPVARVDSRFVGPEVYTIQGVHLRKLKLQMRN